MRRLIGVTALLALAACGEVVSQADYLREACKSAGHPEGTPAFEDCVSEKKLAQLRQIYDLGVRDPQQAAP